MLGDPRERLAQAVDYALADGLLKYTAAGALHHAPFTLTPCPIPRQTALELEALTAPFNALALAVSQDLPFLVETLAPAAKVDPYTAFLLKLGQAGERSQPLQLLVSRSDYFLAGEGPAPRIRQVELNTIAASYPALAGRTLRMHRRIWNGQPEAARLLENAPAGAIAQAMAETVQRYGVAGAAMALIAQPDETNVFDQRQLELELLDLGVDTLRVSLAEIGEQAALREGHLIVRGRTIAIAYYRSGYAPEHLATPSARTGMEKVAGSSTVAVPTPAMHLAGAKKVQQVLANPAALRRFATETDARKMESTFAALHGTEDLVTGPHGSQPAWKVALAAPRQWVLKPQREGGGNNLFDEHLAAALRGSMAHDRQAYILMERIVPRTHEAWLVREGHVESARSVSEIGRYGTLLANGRDILLNRDVGYLVRTRPANLHEGGVSAGYGFLDSLIADA